MTNTAAAGFGVWLAKKIAELRISRAELARRMNATGPRTGLTSSTVTRWISGSRPSSENLHQLAKVLKTDHAELLRRAGYTTSTGRPTNEIVEELNGMLDPERGLPEPRRTALEQTLALLAEAARPYMPQRKAG